MLIAGEVKIMAIALLPHLVKLENIDKMILGNLGNITRMDLVLPLD